MKQDLEMRPTHMEKDPETRNNTQKWGQYIWNKTQKRDQRALARAISHICLRSIGTSNICRKRPIYIFDIYEITPRNEANTYETRPRNEYHIYASAVSARDIYFTRGLYIYLTYSQLQIGFRSKRPTYECQKKPIYKKARQIYVAHIGTGNCR